MKNISQKKNIYTVTCNIFSRWLGKVFLLNAISSCFYFFRFYFCTCNHIYRCIRERKAHTQIPPFAMIFMIDILFIFHRVAITAVAVASAFNMQNEWFVVVAAFFAIHNICLASFSKVDFFHTHTHRQTHSHTSSRCSFLCTMFRLQFCFSKHIFFAMFHLPVERLMQCEVIATTDKERIPLAKRIIVKLSLDDLIPCLYLFLYVERSWKFFHAFTLLSLPSKCEIWNFFCARKQNTDDICAKKRWC